jgi:hypothetical protein
LLKNHHSFAEFFYTNAYNKLKHPELYLEPSKEFEVERFGCDIGDAFSWFNVAGIATQTSLNISLSD